MNKRVISLAMLIAAVTLGYGCKCETSQMVEKPRMIITCDPELDDSNSMIRYLLHATDFQIDGLIYTSSQVHWAGDGVTTMYRPGREYTRITKNGKPLGPQLSWRWKDGERFIDEIVELYGKVYPNLIVHNPDYPTPEYLKSVTKYGNIYFDGDYSYDSEGSELIRTAILDDKPGKLYIGAWGGCSTIARALYVIDSTYKDSPEWPNVQKKVNDKVVLLLSGDQDQTYANYIKVKWPDIQQYAATNGPSLGYGASKSIPEEYRYMMEPKWMKKNILDKGPLGAYYRVWGDGKFMCPGDPTDYFGYCSEDVTAEELREKEYLVWTALMPRGTWISEGDTPTYINFIDNGLFAWKDDTYGGWGGRRKIGTSGDNSSLFGGGSSNPEIAPQGNAKLAARMGLNVPVVAKEPVAKPRAAAPVGQQMFPPMNRARRGDDAIPKNFIEAIQNELAARLDWSVKSAYEDANHHPVIKAVGEMTVNAGSSVKIKAKTSDPDNDNLDVSWWQFKVGSYEGEVSIENAGANGAVVSIPADAKSGDTIHIIIEAKDNGTPQLTRYHRIILTVS